MEPLAETVDLVPRRQERRGSFDELIVRLPERLREPALSEARRAYLENPEGFRVNCLEVALREGHRPPALLRYLVQKKAHLDPLPEPSPRSIEEQRKRGLSTREILHLADELRDRGL